MKTQYSILVYVTVDHDPDDNEPNQSGPDAARTVLRAVTTAYRGAGVDVDGELIETDVKS